SGVSTFITVGPTRLVELWASVVHLPLDWDAVFPGAARVELPTYPFQRRWFWQHAQRPLLESLVPLAEGGAAGTGTLALTTHRWPPPAAVPVALDGLYDRFAESGYAYGPVFQGLRAAWRCGSDTLAEVHLPEPGDPGGYRLHPALLDAAQHALALDLTQTPMPF